VGQQLSPDLRGYFVHTLELFDRKSGEELESLYQALTADSGITPLLPLFLQFMAGKLTLKCDDTETVKRIGLMGLALARNSSLPVYFFAHAFIRTAMTVLLRNETGGNIDEDIEVRYIGADFLMETIGRCANGFPAIAAVAQNALISAWLNPRVTHAAQLGAFIGICRLGRTPVMRALPHVPGYLVSLRRELQIGDPRKRALVRTVLVDISQLLKEQLVLLPGDEQRKWETVGAEMEALGHNSEGRSSGDIAQ
jgi:hypothetical protein